MKRFNQLIAIIALVFSVSATAAEKIYFVQTDHLGSPEMLTDENQTVVWQASQDPFGNSVPVVEQVAFDFRFPGQFYDAESGLFYNWNRYYDPKSGRYVTSDPIGLDGGLNSFAYVLGNPLAFYDPRGLEPNQTCVRICTALGAYAGGQLGLRGGIALGGTLGAGAGTATAGPGPGTVVGGGLGAVAGGAAGATAGTLGGGALGQSIGEAACPDDDNDDKDCKKASPFQLIAAGITDAHAYKTDFGAVPNSRFDICACKDGRIIIKAQGQCGKPGPSIETGDRWK